MDLTSAYTALGIGRLSSQEEQYALNLVRGLNPTAAARAAGSKHPARAVAGWAENEDIVLCVGYLREISRQQALSAGAVEFSKDDATRLYLEAHAHAESATEEIKAVDSLVKLHGLAEPEKREIKITRRDQLDQLSDEELAKLAGQDDILLDPSQYQRVAGE